MVGSGEIEDQAGLAMAESLAVDLEEPVLQASSAFFNSSLYPLPCFDSQPIFLEENGGGNTHPVRWPPATGTPARCWRPRGRE